MPSKIKDREESSCFAKKQFEIWHYKQNTCRSRHKSSVCWRLNNILASIITYKQTVPEIQHHNSRTAFNLAFIHSRAMLFIILYPLIMGTSPTALCSFEMQNKIQWTSKDLTGVNQIFASYRYYSTGRSCCSINTN